ncbi:MAG: OmpA family protein [Marivibrio sp.]|uniref:OmpA family protein n=1 Tax=Marivibrio sp. TaxID=2039719 RepID=UPI0032EC2501
MADDYDGLRPGEILMDASVAEFVTTLGLGVAEAQRALDVNSVEQLDAFIAPIEGLGGRTLLEMGLQPAFYHFQHADVSCSLQLSLKVGKEFGLDFGIEGSFRDGETSQERRDRAETERASGTRVASRSRSAEVEIKATTVGALSVNGRSFDLAGDDPLGRIHSLAEALREGGSVDTVIPSAERTPVNPTTDADPEKVVVSPNAVSFVGAGHARGFIRISSRPSAAVEYVLNDETTLTVPRSASKEAHAVALSEAIDAAEGFESGVLIPGQPPYLLAAAFEHNKAELKADVGRYRNFRMLQILADLLKETGEEVTVCGAADRSGEPSRNDPLSLSRAEAVERYLIDAGVPAGQLSSRGLGEDIWADADDGERNPDHRIVFLEFRSGALYVLVRALGAAALENVAPDKLGGAAGNGWVHLYRPVDLAGLAGTVTIKGVGFPLEGGAAAGHAANSPEAFAANLAGAVNADGDLGVLASPQGHVVTLMNRGDRFRLQLVTSSTEDVRLSGRSDVTVTEQFSRSRTERETESRSGNRAVAVGASLGVDYRRRFDMDVTGNSAVSARLVSVPAPPEFLETMRTFLSEDRED